MNVAAALKHKTTHITIQHSIKTQNNTHNNAGEKGLTASKRTRLASLGRSHCRYARDLVAQLRCRMESPIQLLDQLTEVWHVQGSWLGSQREHNKQNIKTCTEQVRGAHTKHRIHKGGTSTFRCGAFLQLGGFCLD